MDVMNQRLTATAEYAWPRRAHHARGAEDEDEHDSLRCITARQGREFKAFWGESCMVQKRMHREALLLLVRDGQQEKGDKSPC